MGSMQMGPKAFLAIAAMVLAVLGVAGLAAFFAARDEATVPSQQSDRPGVSRPAGAQPEVKPGNVVLQYSDERLTSRLSALAERTAGAPSAALEAAGQAVVLDRRPNLTVPVTAVTATRRLQATGPDDPQLRLFVEYWLGRAS